VNHTLNIANTQNANSPTSSLASNVAEDTYVRFAGMQVDKSLYSFVEQEVLPGVGLDAGEFWRNFCALVEELDPKNTALIEQRESFQAKIDRWHAEHRSEDFDKARYHEFLQNIGYIAPRVGDFRIGTQQVDDEIAVQAGPQLVVPLKNARFALNAANARWGSLYDALYGTDVIEDDGQTAKGQHYNLQRGAIAVKMGRDLLDDIIPLVMGSHHDAIGYHVDEGALLVTLKDKCVSVLREPSKFLGFQGASAKPSCVLVENHGMRAELLFDASSSIGRSDPAALKDIMLESALTTIVDCEDSVAAVDGEDKLEVYRNWLGLMKGDLNSTFSKVGADNQLRTVTRTLNQDRYYIDGEGKSFSLPGRSLLFIRNVGHLMTTPAVLDGDGREVHEGIVDAVITSLIALYDLQDLSARVNSRKKSIYIVKPKMHGPEEVAFANKLFSRVESMLGLPQNTIKMGIMDEERRTTLNLKSCIKQAADRVAFINTGFLDRTGDEIHTSMQAGPMIPKSMMKAQAWIKAYEEWNVDIGLDCGLSGKAQIGKGMWPMPDRMAEMLCTKISHPQAGANTAWVPSPTAATIHAIHYHKVDVFKQQKMIENRINRDAELCFDQLLEIPLLVDRSQLTPEIIRAEIDNNCQGILGYVVRWIDQGIGCSKVPDINNVGLMEDRATLRISSQYLANWMLHGVCTRAQIEDALVRMAAVVDEQNQDDESYEAMVPALSSSIAFKAASDLIFKGVSQPSGYTEPLLHWYRQLKKQQDRQQH